MSDRLEKQPSRRSARKSGGREARIAARRAGTAGAVVRPGMEGGRYRPLTDRDIERIHSTALDVLENIGIGEPIPEILEATLPKGCILGDDGRLRFPRALVEDMIATAGKQYVLYAPSDSNLDIEIKERGVVMSTSGEAVKILDFETQQDRKSVV